MNDIEEYIALKELEDRLKAEYHEVKTEREALRDKLAGEMDRTGQAALIGHESGKRVSTVYTTIATIEDLRALKGWAIETGQQDVYIKEVANQSECSALVREYKDKGILDQLPPGLSFISKINLRVTTPKNGNNGFSQAGQSVLEMLKGGK